MTKEAQSTTGKTQSHKLNEASAFMRDLNDDSDGGQLTSLRKEY